MTPSLKSRLLAFLVEREYSNRGDGTLRCGRCGYLTTPQQAEYRRIPEMGHHAGCSYVALLAELRALHVSRTPEEEIATW